MVDEPRKMTASYGQMVWGIALALAGVGVFFRIGEALERLKEYPAFNGGVTVFFAKLSFFLMGVILLGGGIKKIMAQYALLTKKDDSSGAGN